MIDTNRTNTNESTNTCSRCTDDSSVLDGLPVNRHTVIKAGAAGLGLVSLVGFGSSTVSSHHEPVNKPAAAGSTVDIFSSPQGTDGSAVQTLLEIPNVKISNSEQDTLVFQPTVESSLFTRVESDGGGKGKKKKDTDGTQGWDSVANAGVLAWIEIRGDATGDSWKMIDVEGHITDKPPLQTPSDFVDSDGTLSGVADAVVTFNSRDFKLEWDMQDLIDAVNELQESVYEESEEFDRLLDLLMRSRSSNGFNWIVRGVNGVNDLRLRGALYDFTDGDAEARAVVGNRSMVVQAMKLPHDVY